MAKELDGQLSLLAEDADYTGELSRPDWAIDVGDYEDEWELVTNPAPPIQERSLQEMRSAFIDRANGRMPKVTMPVVTTLDGDDLIVTMPVVTTPDGDDLIVTMPVVTTPDGDDSIVTMPVVTNRPRKHPIANLYRKWSDNRRYWCLRPYVDGERKFFHLDRDYERAIAKGKKIYDRLAAGESIATIKESIERGEI